jgi:ABC-type transport system involved in multi-copper enzyme maturation permease subunit
MTATTLGPATRPSRQVGHTTFGQSLRAEWTKIRTVRSTYWTLAVGVLVSVGLTVLACASIAAHVRNHPNDVPNEPSIQFALAGLFFGQIAFAVLGAMTVTAEYSTGMIRTSLSAVPRRGRFLGSKALIFAIVALILGEIISFVSFYVGEALLGGAKEMHTQAIGDPGVLRAVIGGGAYLTLIALLALGIGLLLRHTAGAITSILGLMLIPAFFGGLLPQWWQDHVINYFPTVAGGQILTTHTRAHELSPTAGIITLIVWVVVVLAGAFALFKKRDA